MVFTYPYPLHRKAGRRYHRVMVFTDPTTVFVTTPAANMVGLDPSMKGLLYRTSNGGWAQDQNGDHITCWYKRANFTASTPIELRTLDMGGNGNIDNIDILTPAIVPTGCDVFYGTYKADGTYARLGPIDPNNAATNLLAGRPSTFRLAVELVPTGRTAPIIDMAPTAIGTTATVPGRRAGTLTAQSAVRAPKDASGNPVAVTQISQVLTLQNYNPAAPVSDTFGVQLGVGANFATARAPDKTIGPTLQSDGTYQVTFSWALTSGVTTWVQNYSGTTQDVTQLFTIPKAVTNAAP